MKPRKWKRVANRLLKKRGLRVERRWFSINEDCTVLEIDDGSLRDIVGRGPDKVLVPCERVASLSLRGLADWIAEEHNQVRWARVIPVHSVLTFREQYEQQWPGEIIG